MDRLESYRGRFQSTPPCGGDKVCRRAWMERPDFNPRPLAGATMIHKPSCVVSGFQSTPPCGGDWPCVGKILISRKISIHAPLRGRRRRRLPVGSCTQFQSTPPCGGDLILWKSDTELDKISIHAPLRGRPALKMIRACEGVISIHAPLRGRLNRRRRARIVDIFQSTPPCGGDDNISV